MSPTRRARGGRPRRAGFTLLEVIVALGVLGIGLTAAFALLVAGASAGRRAEHATQAPLLADAVFADLGPALAQGLDLDALPRAEPDDAGAGAAAAAGQAALDARWLLRDKTWVTDPGYQYDVAVTPLPGPAHDAAAPRAYLVEVFVRWFERGQGKEARYATVLLRGASCVDLAPPPR